ncbi:hypothetical protein HGM15179_015858 [Zosterops borbonicus]|uniref:ribonuclease H n=1 Tax=Zosterops borbonicus TaxID=364589 RepID=A0A8K1G413_9PASS|nr:hypothetical protein HGM15179_015858 [Zosterops borbonicus]
MPKLGKSCTCKAEEPLGSGIHLDKFTAAVAAGPTQRRGCPRTCEEMEALVKVVRVIDRPVEILHPDIRDRCTKALAEDTMSSGNELQQGHIEPSTSPRNTPVFVIPKQSGEGFRLLHDLHEINRKIQPMGPVQTQLPANSMIPKGQPCAVLDIKDCFFSIPLHSEDKERFAFSVVFPNGQHPNLRFQWKVLPQGMVNSPTICQITVDRVLAPIRYAESTATIIQYMDDILIAAPSTSHVDRLITTSPRP